MGVSFDGKRLEYKVFKYEYKQEWDHEIRKEVDEWNEMIKTDRQERSPIHYAAFSKSP